MNAHTAPIEAVRDALNRDRERAKFTCSLATHHHWVYGVGDDASSQYCARCGCPRLSGSGHAYTSRDWNAR